MTPEWMHRAVCKGRTAAMFPPPQTTGMRPRLHPAVTICAACPVITECRQYALDNNEMFGTWGGLSESRRQQIRRDRKHR